MSGKTHHYRSQLRWTGNRGGGTGDYKTYGRDYDLAVTGKPILAGSADPGFLGDPTRHNPEDLFVGAIAACHMLTYLALCARNDLRVLAYEDQAQGWMEVRADGGGRFGDVLLSPQVTIAADGDPQRARTLHRDAHALCFVASSCNVPIRCQATIVSASAQAGATP